MVTIMVLLPLVGCKNDSVPDNVQKEQVQPGDENNRNTYTVTFDANGGSGTMEQQTFTPNQPHPLTTCTFTKEGHSFDGWSLTKDGPVEYQDKASYPATASATLYAVWTATNTVRSVVASPTSGSPVDAGDTVTLTTTTEGATIHYIVNGGMEQTGASPVSVTIPAAASHPTISAWATKSDMTDSARSEFAYTLKTYTVTFTTDKGTVPAQLTGLTKGSTLPVLPTPTVTGYTFGGWLYGSGSAAKEGDTVTSNLTLTANWIPITYTVFFDAAGYSSDSMESITLTYDQPTKLPKNAFTNSENSIFKEWNTELDGSGTAYADEAEVMNLASTQGAKVYLIAQWTFPVATVQASAGGMTYHQSIDSAIKALTNDSTFTLLQDVTPTSTISIDKAVTFNLNQFTISTNQTPAMTIAAGGNVTLKGTGGITHTGDEKGVAISITSGGSLTIENATISSSGMAIQNSGTLTISGGEITSSTTEAYSTIQINEGATASITAGTITATGRKPAIGNQGTLNISGGTITSANETGILQYLGTEYSAPVLRLSGSPTITGKGTDSSRFPNPGIFLYSPATITGAIGTNITVSTSFENLASGSWTAFMGVDYTIKESDKNNLQPVVTEIPAGAMPTLSNGGTISTALESGSIVVKVTPK